MDQDILTADNESKAILLAAFHLICDHYPESAMLIHKSKTILAVNPVAEALGRMPGDLCTKLGSADMHDGCLSNMALSEQKAMFKSRHFQGNSFTLFWLPVCGYPDCYVHFMAGTCNFES